MKRRWDVFISYSSADKAWVTTLAENLNLAGFEVFLDDWGLVPGSPLAGSLDEALEDSATAVLVASGDAAGSTWVRREHEKMLALEGKHPSFRFVPIFFEEHGDFPFLETVLQIDFRIMPYRRAFHRLVSGLRDEEPGSGDGNYPGVVEPGAIPESSVGVGVPDFIGHVFDALVRIPLVVVIAPDGLPSGPVSQLIRQRSEERWPEAELVHLQPPFCREGEAPAYFAALARQCGCSPVDNATAFELQLGARLDAMPEDGRMLLVITGFENGAAATRRDLAGTVRNLVETYSEKLRVLMTGGGRLAELCFADGGNSLLWGARIFEWPEAGEDDVRSMCDQTLPERTMSGAEIDALYRATGGHPRLVRACLDAHRDREIALSADALNGALLRAPETWQLIRSARSDAVARPRLIELVETNDLGVYRPYLADRVLYELFWRGIVRRTEGERLAWRCEALRQAVREAVGESA